MNNVKYVKNREILAEGDVIGFGTKTENIDLNDPNLFVYKLKLYNPAEVIEILTDDDDEEMSVDQQQPQPVKDEAAPAARITLEEVMLPKDLSENCVSPPASSPFEEVAEMVVAERRTSIEHMAERLDLNRRNEEPEEKFSEQSVTSQSDDENEGSRSPTGEFLNGFFEEIVVGRMALPDSGISEPDTANGVVSDPEASLSPMQIELEAGCSYPEPSLPPQPQLPQPSTSNPEIALPNGRRRSNIDEQLLDKVMRSKEIKKKELESKLVTPQPLRKRRQTVSERQLEDTVNRRSSFERRDVGASTSSAAPCDREVRAAKLAKIGEENRLAREAAERAAAEGRVRVEPKVKLTRQSRGAKLAADFLKQNGR